jgi:hypothetical protein
VKHISVFVVYLMKMFMLGTDCKQNNVHTFLVSDALPTEHKMKMIAIWDIVLYNLIEVDRRFRGSYSLASSGWWIPLHLHTCCHENLKSHKDGEILFYSRIYWLSRNLRVKSVLVSRKLVCHHEILFKEIENYFVVIINHHKATHYFL